MVQVEQLSKIFPPQKSWLRKSTEEPFVAVNNISFTIQQGEVVGLLGPNGAGKTTTLYMLLGTLTPTTGSIKYFGKSLTEERTAILQQLSFASAYTNLPDSLSVIENLEIFGRLYGLTGPLLKERIGTYIDLFGLASKANSLVGSLSAGQKTRAMLAKGFLVHPKMILLDEPTASLDPDIAHEVRSLIIRLQKELGLTVLLASHNMDEVATICNRVIVLSRGTIIADSSPELLAQSVARVSIHLVVTEGMTALTAHLERQGLSYLLQDRVIEIEVGEERISALLGQLAAQGVEYSSIIIQKPTLEDYFLKIARSSRGVVQGLNNKEIV